MKEPKHTPGPWQPINEPAPYVKPKPSQANFHEDKEINNPDQWRSLGAVMFLDEDQAEWFYVSVMEPHNISQTFRMRC